MTQIPPAELRRILAEETGRPFDIAQRLGVPEAALVAARAGQGVTRIDATLARLIPAIQTMGEVMSLTRNRSCVIEKVGIYNNFHDGDHAAMTLDRNIDLRMFPKYWTHGFAVETPGENGVRRSVQIFDAAGDATHKVHLRPDSDLSGWEALRRDLALVDQSDTIEFAARAPVESARIAPDRVEVLREEWARMTDTHQFNTLVRRVKMNRLGAYRSVGAPHVRPLAIQSVQDLFDRLLADGLGVMVFVGNQGCIGIHSGPIHSLKMMGPWLNVLDPGFNLHLRADHIAEVWAVDKPTKRGAAISVEAFDDEGALILQIFGLRPDLGGDPDAWAALVADLPALDPVTA